jgi:1-pyrroline-5-carboxylate dehydrogenase
MFTPYRNEPYVNFLDEEPRRRMQEALKLVESQLGAEYSPVIGGKRVTTVDKIISINPAKTDQVIGTVGSCTAEDAENAVRVASEAFATWSKVDPMLRARYLVKVAAILRRRIYEFSAWMVYEVSKSWLEAYADAAEAIDFLEFYARQMEKMANGVPTTEFPGEENEVRYIPLGVGAAISPWNFPLAIMAGMTTAAVVTGNTVVMKPAEQSTVIAAKFFEVLEEASLPAGVVNFVPGPGEIVGELLTGHPQVRFISFTGSRDVGVHINRRAAEVPKGQKWLKRVVLEMGGKDCMVVDETADLEDAADAVVAAAFGFQGQKCSACSRLIAHQDIYDALLEKVVVRASNLSVGNPVDHANSMGAVVDEEAFNKIKSYIEIGRGEGRLVLGDEAPVEGGYFIRPTIIADIAPDARIAQEEIFGPVLAVIKAKDFDDALAIANGTEYGLTGGLFSNDRTRLERARHEFHVGNLYLNRKCTGALVDVQPFGGFNMSGTDSKAGGRDYLQLFMQVKAISERW